MKNSRLTVMVSSICLVLGAFTASHTFADQPFPWPNGAKAGVNLAYDDALASQLDYVIPQLDKAGIQGTFYLSLASETITSRLPEWRAAAARGHELGNHTLFHQCSKGAPNREWVSADRDLDTMSVSEITDHITLANNFLHAIDGKTERTFTPPCIDDKAGGQPYWPSIIPQFVALKGGFDGVANNMWEVDPYKVGVFFPNGQSGAELIALVKQAAEKGTMVNFTFHGVGGDHMNVSAEAHQELVNYLAKNKKTYYVDTFVNLMKHVKETQAKHK